MDEHDLHHIWLRLVGHQEVAPWERTALHDWLQQDPLVGRQLCLDRQVDSLLRSVGRELDESSFVDEFVRRLDIESRCNEPEAPPIVAGTTRPTVQLADEQQPRKRRRGAGSLSAMQLAILACCVAVSAMILIQVFVSSRGGDDPPVADQLEKTAPEAAPRIDPVPVPDPGMKPNESRPSLPVTPQPTRPPAERRGLSDFAANPGGGSSVAGAPDSDPPPRGVSPADEPPPSDESKTPQIVIERPPDGAMASVVAQLTKTTEDAVWHGGTPALGDLPRRVLKLEAGSAELEMAGGTVVSLFAPVHLEVVSPDKLALSRGKIVAVVGVQGQGFEVETPSARIVDLGTEFSVNVSSDGETSVEVSRGVVEVTPRGAGSPGRVWRLEAGDFKWLSADGAEDLDWRLVIRFDEQGVGTMQLNDQRYLFADRADFNLAHDVLSDQLMRLSSRFRYAGNKVPARGEARINARKFTFTNRASFNKLRLEVPRLFRELWEEAASRSENSESSFRGVININGHEIRFNSLEELRKAQAEMQQRNRDLQSAPDP